MAPATSNEAPKPACLPESGKLPPALLNPNSIVILRAFTAIDQIVAIGYEYAREKIGEWKEKFNIG